MLAVTRSETGTWVEEEPVREGVSFTIDYDHLEQILREGSLPELMLPHWQLGNDECIKHLQVSEQGITVYIGKRDEEEKN